MIDRALLYHVASGQAFFSGAAFILIAAIAPDRSPGRWGTLARTVATCLGLCLIAVSATPMPIWSYALAGIITVAWLGVQGARGKVSPVARRSLRVAVVVVWTLGVALELPYHLVPTLPRMGRSPVFVVGDSLSAGMGGEAETWPTLLDARHDLEVHNLAIAGSGVSRASRDQAGRVADPDALVIAEIGGNDVLGGTTAEDFGRGLDALLGQLCAEGRKVVLLELPLPPSFNEFGAIQRRLARRHGAILVPKRVLLGVLTAGGATVDTIHLSRTGHERLAEAIWGVIRPAFDP